jgi:hypothetical protein
LFAYKNYLRANVRSLEPLVAEELDTLIDAQACFSWEKPFNASRARASQMKSLFSLINKATKVANSAFDPAVRVALA